MRYKSIIKYDVANGPGLRTTVFFTGCTLHCKNCFNSEMWSFNSGLLFDEETKNKVIELVSDPHCSGLSILGGEPTDQGIELIKFLQEVKSIIPNKEIWLWSGRTYEAIKKEYPEFLSVIDVLIDGPFIEDKKDVTLKWRGSSNQRIIYVKDKKLDDESILVD